MKRMLLIAAVTLIPAAASAQATLAISQASWGYAGERKNVKDDVAKLCDGKASCKFKVANETFSSGEPQDPSPGNPKGLIVRWKCGDADGRDQFPQNKDAELKCK